MVSSFKTILIAFFVILSPCMFNTKEIEVGQMTHKLCMLACGLHFIQLALLRKSIIPTRRNAPGGLRRYYHLPTPLYLVHVGKVPFRMQNSRCIFHSDKCFTSREDLQNGIAIYYGNYHLYSRSSESTLSGLRLGCARCRLLVFLTSMLL